MTASATTPSTVTGALSDRAHLGSRTGFRPTSPHAKQIPNHQRAQTLASAVFRLVQRILVAEASIWLTVVLCALAGFPAALTAFSVALVSFVMNCWLAVRTLLPVCRNLWCGGHG